MRGKVKSSFVTFGIIFVLAILSLSFISANVYINEVELNPAGTDSGNEWVEFFADAETNVTGWYLTDKDGNQFFLDDVLILENSFYVLEGITSFINTEENITLYDNFDSEIDFAGGLNDSANDGKTWQRIPDGTGDFSFLENTSGFPNQLISITNKEIENACLIKGDNVTLSVSVDGFCVEDVIFSIETGNGWANYSGVKDDKNYSFMINSGELNKTGNFSWTVYVSDCFNQTTKNGDENFYVSNKTELSVSFSPDGFNGWYLTEPSFSLANGDAVNILYTWDGNNIFNFSSPFGLENSPNNGNITGGIHKLRYWSNVSCKNEEQNEEILKFDFFNPAIENINPNFGSVVSDAIINFSAFINEKYQSNSGISLADVKMWVDDFMVNASLRNISLDAWVNYSMSLENGNHNVSVYAKDNSGRESEKNWTFVVDKGITGEIIINSPMQNEIYMERRIMVNLSFNKMFDKISYIDNADERARERIICRNNCESYGLNGKKFIYLQEGYHNLTIIGYANGERVEENVEFFVDYKNPRIKKVEPRGGLNSGMFEVQFYEENPSEIKVMYGNESDMRMEDVSLNNCVRERNLMSCMFNLTLGEFEGQEINYFVNVSDISGNNDVSRESRFVVDTIAPVVTQFHYTINKRRVMFSFDVVEANFKQITYTDLNEKNPRDFRLCTRLKEGSCEKSASFRNGEHNLTFTIMDEAENYSTIEGIIFSV